MQRTRMTCSMLFIWLGWLALLLGTVPAWAAPAPVVVVPLQGAIGPATSDYVLRSFEQARERGAQLVVLQLDTPGGLDLAMRDIIRAILDSPFPVVGYVAPGGARAASAGTYILYACHIAAMAPGTNLGAATPISLTGQDGESTAAARKSINDASAYMRGLAELRGRNVQWAERAVREAVSLPATEALQEHVIDRLATDVPDLLTRLDGLSVSIHDEQRVLHPLGAELITITPTWHERLLALITNPSVALILLMLGFYGLVFELLMPGIGVPGIMGSICLLVALYALHLLPLSYAGAALLLLGLGLMVSEAMVPSFGILGLGGLIAFASGAFMLIDTEAPGFGISLWLIAGLALLSALFLAVIVGMALQARRQKVVTGDEELTGTLAQVIQLQDNDVYRGMAIVRGEQWQIRSPAPLHPGQTVQVQARHGLVLDVAIVNEPHPGES